MSGNRKRLGRVTVTAAERPPGWIVSASLHSRPDSDGAIRSSSRTGYHPEYSTAVGAAMWCAWNGLRNYGAKPRDYVDLELAGADGPGTRIRVTLKELLP